MVVYCDSNGKILTTGTYINNFPLLLTPTSKGGPCEGASNINHKESGNITILGKSYNTIVLYDTSMESCNYLDFLSSSINSSKDFNADYESKRTNIVDTSVNSKWNYLYLNSLSQIRDTPNQYGLSNTAKLIIQSIKYY